MKNSKKILSAVLASAMILTLTACSGDANIGNTFNAFNTMSESPTEDFEYEYNDKISSANTLASNIKCRVIEFFTKMDTIKRSYVGGAKTLTITATQNASGGSDWTIDQSATADWLDGKNHYGASVNTMSITTRDTELTAYIADTLADMKQCAATIYIGADGSVIGVAVIEGESAVPAGAVIPSSTDFTRGSMTWAGGKSGLAFNDIVIGTAPVIAHQ